MHVAFIADCTLQPFSGFPRESLTAKCYGRAELGALLKTCCCGPQETMLASSTWKTPLLFAFFYFLFDCSSIQRRESVGNLFSLGACGCACGLIFPIRTPRPEVDLQRLAFTVLSSPSGDTGYIQVKGVEDMPAIHGYTHTHTHTKTQNDHVQFSGWAECSLQEKQAHCQV